MQALVFLCQLARTRIDAGLDLPRLVGVHDNGHLREPGLIGVLAERDLDERLRRVLIRRRRQSERGKEPPHTTLHCGRTAQQRPTGHEHPLDALPLGRLKVFQFAKHGLAGRHAHLPRTGHDEHARQRGSHGVTRFGPRLRRTDTDSEPGRQIVGSELAGHELTRVALPLVDLENVVSRDDASVGRREGVHRGVGAARDVRGRDGELFEGASLGVELGEFLINGYRVHRERRRLTPVDRRTRCDLEEFDAHRVPRLDPRFERQRTNGGQHLGHVVMLCCLHASFYRTYVRIARVAPTQFQRVARPPAMLLKRRSIRSSRASNPSKPFVAPSVSKPTLR